MTISSKIKKVAKEVNGFTLIGAMALSTILMSFDINEGKQGITDEISQTLVTHGVLSHEEGDDENPGKLWLTNSTVGEFQGSCGSAGFACKIRIDASLIQTDGSGNKYIEDDATYTVVSPSGPYSNTP